MQKLLETEKMKDTAPTQNPDGENSASTLSKQPLR